MKIDYNYYSLKEIGKVVTGKTPVTTIEKYYFPKEYMFISPTELHNGYNIELSQKMISSSGLQSIYSNSLSDTSVLVGCIGWDMGNVGISHYKCATNQQINAITNIKEFCNPYYLYYWFKTKKQYLFSIASITRTPILNKSTFENIIVPIPSLERQNEIVSLLKKIDDLISINNKINDNLYC